jgi:hypothetical protein
MLSLEGEELQKLLLGMGSCDPNVFWGTDEAGPQQQGTGDPLLRLTSDGAMLSELMHVLGGDSVRGDEHQEGAHKILAEDAQEKATGRDEKVGHEHIDDIMAQNAPLFSEKTMNMILGEQLRNIAAEYRCDNGSDRSQDAKEKLGPSRSNILETATKRTSQQHMYDQPSHQMNIMPHNSSTRLNDEKCLDRGTGVLERRSNLPQELLQEAYSGGNLHSNQFVNQTQAGYVDHIGPTTDQSKAEQQYITLLDGRILQRSNGSAVVATLPEGQIHLTVPIPGSSSVLQYVPVLDSKIVTHPVDEQRNGISQMQLNISNEPSRGFAQHSVINSSAHLSVSATDQLVEAAALQHRMLTERCSLSTEIRQESNKMEPCLTNAVHHKPIPKLVPLFSPNTSPHVPIEAKALDGQSILESLPSSTSEIGISRKPSHKRERSLASTDLLASEQLHAPQLKQANANSLVSGKVETSLPNLESSMNIKLLSHDEPRRDHSVQQNNLPSPTETECPISVDLGNITDASLPRLLKYYKQEIEIDEETSKLIENTLSVPEGTKRRGRPPGKKNSSCNIPGYIEPTDSEILAALLNEDPGRKLMPPEELKKLVRKEKNRISAAFSRIKSDYETKKLEGEIQQLEAECLALSEWLNSSVSSSPEVLPHRLLLSNGQKISIKDPSEVIKPLVRHLSL